MNTVIYFDIGQTLGSVELPLGGRPILHPFKGVAEVLRRLKAQGVLIGVLSNTGDLDVSAVDASLDDAGLRQYTHPRLRLYSGETGISKDRTEAFEHAIGRAVGVSEGCPRVLFVGENRAERALATMAGMEAVVSPLLVEAALDRSEFAFTSVPRRTAVRTGLVPLGTDPRDPSRLLGLTTAASREAIQAEGHTPTLLLRDADAVMDDAYVLRRAPPAGIPAADAGPCCIVALSAWQSLPAHAHEVATHGHSTKLLPDASLWTAGERSAIAPPEVSDDLLSFVTAVVEEAEMSDRLQAIIGDDVGRNRHVASPGMSQVEERLAALLEEEGEGAFAVSFQPFSLPLSGGAGGAPASLELRNVIAELPGQTDEVVLVTAHLDSTASSSYGPLYDPSAHEAPGADDDASGCVAVLLAARCARLLFADAPPRRTLRFVLFNAEEQGLVGSQVYARAAAQRGDNIVAVFQMDMIGYNSQAPNTFETHAGTSSSGPPLFPAVEAQALQLAGVIREVSSRLQATGASICEPSQILASPDPAAGRSDHASFLDRGFPAVVTSEDFFASPAAPADSNPNYHRATDLLVDIPYATSLARTVAGAAMAFAGGAAAVRPQPAPPAALESLSQSLMFTRSRRSYPADLVAALDETGLKEITRTVIAKRSTVDAERLARAEALLGSLDPVHRGLSLTDVIEQLLELADRIDTAHPGRLRQELLGIINGTSVLESAGFADVLVYETPSFRIRFTIAGPGAVEDDHGPVVIEEPGPAPRRVLATLGPEKVPAYVRKVGYWLERALSVYTAPPFSLRNPARNGKLSAQIIPTDFGGASPSGFFVGNSLSDDMLVAVTVHEFFHMVQYEYGLSGVWRNALIEGGATLAEDSLADGMNRYLLEGGDVFNGPGVLIKPNQNISSARYKSVMLWRYIAEQHGRDPGRYDPATYRHILEAAEADGGGTATIARAVSELSFGTDLLRFERLQGEVVRDETTFGNYVLAMLLKDEPTGDARFTLQENPESIWFDDALREYGIPVPEVEKTIPATRQTHTLAAAPITIEDEVGRLGSQYIIFELDPSVEHVELSLETTGTLRGPLLQVALLGEHALLDLWRSDTDPVRLRFSTTRDGQRGTRIAAAITGVTSYGRFRLSAQAIPARPELVVSAADARPGASYPQDPRYTAWQGGSPDISVSGGELSVTVHNHGAAAAAVQLEVSVWLGQGDWMPAASATDVQVEARSSTTRTWSVAAAGYHGRHPVRVVVQHEGEAQTRVALVSFSG